MHVPRSKITAPALPAGLVDRPALAAQLGRAEPGQLLLLSAPAGYGKTLMLADWVRGGPPTAWVTVDRDDDAPRLSAALLDALAALPALGPDGRLRRAEAPVGPGDGVDRVVEAVEAAGTPVRLVLDDVHLLAGGEPLRDLARLVHRCSPPAPTRRWRCPACGSRAGCTRCAPPRCGSPRARPPRCCAARGSS